MRTLILWAMSSSDALKAIINQAYKQNRHEDDLNQPKAVQPWGSDGDKRRYFLVEGHDDTGFRVYRESNPAGSNRTWWSVAGSIEELKTLAEKLEVKDGGPKAKTLATKMLQAIPRFEAGEDVKLTTLQTPWSTNANDFDRNEREGSIARCARNNSNAPNLGFPCMRAAHAANG